MIGFGMGFSTVFALPAAISFDRGADGFSIYIFIGPFFFELSWGGQ